MTEPHKLRHGGILAWREWNVLTQPISPRMPFFEISITGFGPPLLVKQVQYSENHHRGEITPIGSGIPFPTVETVGYCRTSLTGRNHRPIRSVPIVHNVRIKRV
jgi:hypothetical protein